MDKRLWAEAVKNRSLLYIAITLSITAGVIVVLQAAFLARIINLAFLQKAALAEIAPWLAAFAIEIGARAALNWAGAYAAGELAIRIKLALRGRVMNHVTALGPVFTAEERSGELTNTVTEGIESLNAYFREAQ